MPKRNFKYDVFISYSSTDKAIVLPLAERLGRDGYKVWLDKWNIVYGGPIPKQIDDGLDNSRILLACLSENYNKSDWAQLESYTYRFRDPLNKHQSFIPLKLDDSPIKGTVKIFKYVNWYDNKIREQEYANLTEAISSSSKWRKRFLEENKTHLFKAKIKICNNRDDIVIQIAKMIDSTQDTLCVAGVANTYFFGGKCPSLYNKLVDALKKINAIFIFLNPKSQAAKRRSKYEADRLGTIAEIKACIKTARRVRNIVGVEKLKIKLVNEMPCFMCINEEKLIIQPYLYSVFGHETIVMEVPRENPAYDYSKRHFDLLCQ
jgi:hypothetical protein